MARCNYDVLDEIDDVIYIVDLDIGNMSVTNDAESVCIELTSRYGINKRIIYRDSNGDWAEMIHRNGEFLRFRHINMDVDNPHKILLDLTVN
jgi:hypothetical protein